MGTLYLSVELAFDMLACIIGCVLTFQAKDNNQKRYWGIIAVCIGAVFIWENIGWLMIVTDTPNYRFTDLLNIEKMLKWYIPASIVCLFPTASLCPGYLTPFRILILQLLPLITVTTGLSYLGFNGHFTPILSLSEVFPNLGKNRCTPPMYHILDYHHHTDSLRALSHCSSQSIPENQQRNVSVHRIHDVVPRHIHSVYVEYQ